MNNYVEIVFENISADQAEMLIAELSEAGYEGFEEGENLLKAFISAGIFDKAATLEIARNHATLFKELVIGETNWNAVWESNFQPVVVDDFVMVRADFHEPARGVEVEIIITPKMSFGTGHHATTFMMIQAMREIDFRGKAVLDFGTGTGVLAILAEKLGAKRIVAIDNDEWSISNAAENIQRNDCNLIELKKAGTALLPESFDIILANINKNIILDNFSHLTDQARKGGTIVLSGLLEEDEEEISHIGNEQLLVFATGKKKDNWLCLKFIR